MYQRNTGRIDAKIYPARASRKAFPASFYGDDGRQRSKIENKEQADQILAELEGAEYKIVEASKRARAANPLRRRLSPPPCSRRPRASLGFQARRTMKAAQELYEGVEIEGMGAVGLITYMRTDSLRLSEDALKDAADYIVERWGKKYLPDTPRHFKTKSKRPGWARGHPADDAQPDARSGERQPDVRISINSIS